MNIKEVSQQKLIHALYKIAYKYMRREYEDVYRQAPSELKPLIENTLQEEINETLKTL